MSSRSDVVLHYKRKFYLLFIDPDFVVEPISFNSSSQTSRPSSMTSSSSSSSQQTRAQNSGSTGGKSAQAGTNVRSVHLDRQTIRFSVNAWVCIVAVLATFLLVPGIFLIEHIIYHFWKPRAWNLQAIQTWLQSVIATKDFIYFLYSLTFVMSQLQIKLALILVVCRSVEVIAKFLRRNCTNSSIYRKYLEEPCVWVESNLATLNITSSNAEVGLGFIFVAT